MLDQQPTPQWLVPLQEAPHIAHIGVGSRVRAVDEWCLPDLWSLHLYGYTGELEVAGEVLPIAPGRISLVPPNVATRYRYHGEAVHLFAHIRLPAGVPEECVTLPTMLDCGADLARIRDRFQTALDFHARLPQLARAELWSLLCHLAGRQISEHDDALGLHPAVRDALGWIEARLGEPISVAALADRVGLSHNHLTRLFRTQLDSTVVGYVRGRRLARAHHLLTRSELPVKTVATAVGFADPQSFNKAFRQAYNAPPSAVRDGVITRSRKGG
ncbi:helix-turn-helix domain-containing protein [Streptomyces hainanensis]|uniref:Helix-turn-helix domain-containing protein n=1 Tax=Streptomyces hainanensis TaxID=402648 RepID=A0A4R4TDC9_9ACTN|nr:helix-turn-helix domain-containing protein [Streptomyces hainanensis]TDC73162.1 helix-turn-helix domain-containing protein [Streptomyces hainanensis]